MSFQFKQSLLPSLRQAFFTTKNTTLWLLKLMIPISLAVRILGFWGVIDTVANFFTPLFRHLGLPGSSAIVFITTAANTTYAGIAVMMSIPLTLRQATILSIMMLLCHALPIESAVNHKTGSSFSKMCLLRIFMAFLAAFCLNIVLPQMGTPFNTSHILNTDSTFMEMLCDWGINMFRMCIMIFGLIYILMVIQQLIQQYHLMPYLSRPLHPLMRFFGLPENTAYLWLVGNILGISYGGAVMLEMLNRGEITKDEVNDVNYHLVMNHSLLEDTSIFAAIGISPIWIISTRISFALLVVWTRKLIKRFLHRLRTNSSS